MNDAERPDKKDGAEEVVRLDRIYTRGGDKGMTSLGDGRRVFKTHPRIAAYGTVDELNSVLGLVLQQRGLAARQAKLLRGIQNDLFDLGADLCVPRTPDEVEGARLRVVAAQAQRLEAEIDARTARLGPLRSFILPGGRPLAAWLHLARTVCRRAELLVAHLLESESEATNREALVYLNRLSDLLFVMARLANDGGRADVLWQPGAGRDAERAATRVRRPPVRRRAASSGKAQSGRKRGPQRGPRGRPKTAPKRRPGSTRRAPRRG